MATACILVVDDEPTTLRLVSKVLTDEYEVLSASTPQTALEIAKSRPAIDLVISDVEMPEMRGPDLLAEISRISPSTAGLLMSGSSQVVAGLPASTRFLKKPFSSKELCDIVKDVLACSHKLEAELTKTMERTTALINQAHRLEYELDETMRASAAILQNSDNLRDQTKKQSRKVPDQIICTFCAAVISANLSFCDHCNRPVGSYTIVRDGYNFLICLNGEVKIHGLMTLEGAQKLASLLNDIISD